MEEIKKVQVESSNDQMKKMIEALKSQNTQLMYQLQNANMANLFKRLDYLFKVLENAVVFDEEFVNQCITEIKELMTPPEHEETSEE